MFVTLPSLRPPQLGVLRKELARAVPVAARLAGIELTSERRSHRVGSLGVLALGLLWLFSPGSPLSNGFAIACFLVALVLRFGFLFASFTPRGIARKLVTRFGVERGHLLYAMALDLLLYLQRLSFVALACATAREPGGPFGVVLMMLGVLAVISGVGITIWAARVAGHEAYQYRDLFTGARNVAIADGGPYALSPNPMYAFGPLAGYGIAMLTLSPVALLAAGVNQALLFVFNELVEQPRLKRANAIFVETQRRYELARSLLGFDPRLELALRRHADVPGQPDLGVLGSESQPPA